MSDHPVSGTRFSLDDVEVGELLGSGALCQVHSAAWGDRRIALKTFFCPDLVEEDAADFSREVQVLRSLHSEYIVQYFAACVDPPRRFIAMEFVPGGSLDSVLRSHASGSPLEVDLLFRIAVEVARALEYLHTEEILHRDLKSANVLLTCVDPQSPSALVKVADFGISRPRSGQGAPLTAMRGTCAWMAPELLTGAVHYSFEVDIYSYGILLWELLVCKEPYGDVRPSFRVPQFVIDGMRPVIPSRAPSPLALLMELCWSSEPQKRPSFSAILGYMRNMASGLGVSEPVLAVLYGRCRTSSSSDGSRELPSMVRPITYLQLPTMDRTPSDDDVPPKLTFRRDSGLLRQSNTVSAYLRSAQVDLEMLNTVGGGVSGQYASWVVDPEEVEITGFLSQGSQGEVLRGKYRGLDVAVKRRRTVWDYLSIEREISLLSELRHPHIVQFLGAMVNLDGMSLITTLHPKGSLAGAFKSSRTLFEDTPALGIQILIDVASALVFMHSVRPFPVIHGDLSSSNILLNDAMRAVLADLGCATQIQFRADTTSARQDKQILGTPRWAAPEMLGLGSDQSIQISTKADVFSFGVLCYEVAALCSPWEGMSEFDISVALEGNWRPPLDDVRLSTPQLRPLIESCLALRPENRPDMSDVYAKLCEVQVLCNVDRARIASACELYQTAYMQSVRASVRSEERLRALRKSGLLDAPEFPELSNLLRLAERATRVPVIIFSLVDCDRQFFHLARGLPEPWATLRETPLSHSYCQHVVHRREPLVVSDANKDPIFQLNLATIDLGVIAYVGFPVFSIDGHAIGSFCLIDTKPREWEADEIDTCREIAEMGTFLISGRARSSHMENCEQMAEEHLVRASAVLEAAIAQPTEANDGGTEDDGLDLLPALLGRAEELANRPGSLVEASELPVDLCAVVSEVIEKFRQSANVAAITTRFPLKRVTSRLASPVLRALVEMMLGFAQAVHSLTGATRPDESCNHQTLVRVVQAARESGCCVVVAAQTDGALRHVAVDTEALELQVMLQPLSALTRRYELEYSSDSTGRVLSIYLP